MYDKLPPNKVQLQRMLLQHCTHEIKVTYLGKGLYGCRCYADGELNQEIVVPKKMISTACKEMLRWEDKCGNWSTYAQSSRHNYKKGF